MATVFSRIIAGELPGHLVWADDDVVAFLSIAPLTPGHTLVVPRQEIDLWTDAPPALQAAVFRAAAAVGVAVRTAFDAPRAGLVVAGFEVPHLHVHVFPAWSMRQFDFASAHPEPDAGRLADAASRIRAALRAAGRTEVTGD
ncbi:HIT family protein [Nakamurella endophytica]|uniref:Hypothetical HIT-like (Histidine triad) protein n=1 Tax=Nakamurella endophytica TaxID=1748367 RepID=A0A917T7R7_9ACTN|nr:HIT family protein [Nakamurella endophytica]GGM13630.1 hypothetical HIT-like (histidine triad) protein [Nakamurella endophytica]